jgi:hypothetical protein
MHAVVKKNDDDKSKGMPPDSWEDGWGLVFKTPARRSKTGVLSVRV